MKEKIFQALKLAILVGGKTSISDATITTYVGLIDAEKITDESQIAEAIKPFVPVLQAVQANINSVAASSVTAKESELNKTIEDLKKSIPQPPKQEPPKDDTPEWAKSLLGKVEGLEGSISVLQGEKLQTALSQKLTEAIKAKGIPEFYSTPATDGRTFKDETEVNAFVESLGQKWDAAKQTLANNGFKETVPPDSGSGETKELSAFAATINQGTKEIVEQQKQN